MSRSSGGWSPFLSSSGSDAEEHDRYLTREMEMLERAVQDKGEVSRRDLGRLVGCKYWGPGRFGHALRQAVKQGRIGHPRRGYYGPAD
jgi:hypothetical protein